MASARGHHPLLPPRLGPTPEPLAADMLETLRDVPLADLSDAVGRLYTCETRLRPAFVGMPRVIGTALTVKAPPGDNWAIHGALSVAGAGHVLVVDWRDHRESCGAGVSALLPAISRGVAGLVIDGSWRDLAEVEAIGFPMMVTGTSPYSPGKERLGEINVPVHCAGVVVEPGDLIVGDAEGVVVVPRAHVTLVADAIDPHPTIARAEDTAADVNQEAVAAIARQYWQEFDQSGGVGGVPPLRATSNEASEQPEQS